MDICKNLTTDIKIYANLNLTKYKKFKKKGYNLFDANSTYFTDICIPMRINDSAVTINDRRKEFNNFNTTCTGRCVYSTFNLSIGYVNCKCNASNTEKEVTTKYETIILNVFKQSNFYIVKCFDTTFSYVRFFLTLA